MLEGSSCISASFVDAFLFISVCSFLFASPLFIGLHDHIVHVERRTRLAGIAEQPWGAVALRAGIFDLQHPFLVLAIRLRPALPAAHRRVTYVGHAALDTG